MFTTFKQFSRVYRHANRYKEIVQVLAKHGFGELISKTGLDSFYSGSKKIFAPSANHEEETRTLWERIRLVLEELGPTFTKFGQIMANRPDLVSPDLVLELEKLQDSVKPFSEEEAKISIETQLGVRVEDLFLEFNPTPIAAASIAQIHKATLKDGREVAVKVQRPNIKRVIDVDLEIMLHLASLIQKFATELSVLDLTGIVKEFKRAIIKEVDFENEAMNMVRFAEMFHDEPAIRIPKHYKELSTATIITMEFIHGIKISNIKEIEDSGLCPVTIASRGADLALQQIFDFGFFHADPHPGNLLILPDNVICYLDYGMVGTLTATTKEHLILVTVGIVSRDPKKIVRDLMRLAQNKYSVNVTELEERVGDLLHKHAYKSLEHLNMVAILNDLVSLFIDYDLKMPSDFYLLLRALLISQATGMKLDPNFDMVSHLEPYAHKIVKERMNPFKLAKELGLSMVELGHLLRDLPGETRDIIEQIKRGKIKVDIEHKGLEPALRTHEQISNRIAFAIVLASMIIGSSLIVLSKIPPLWQGVPIIGIVGFLGAGMLGFWLLISILHHGKM